MRERAQRARAAIDDGLAFSDAGARYADAPLATSLRSADGIRAYDYDWSLNGAPP